MRRLMWFTIGFSASMAAGVYFLWNIGFAIPIIAGIILMGICLTLQLKWKIICRVTVVFAGITAGFCFLFWMKQVYFTPVTVYDGETVFAVITSESYSKETAYGSSIDGRVILEGHSWRGRIYLKGYQTVEPGDELQGLFRFRVTIPGGEKESSYYQGKGIFLIGSQTDDIRVKHPEKTPLRFFPAKLAENVRHILENCFPADVSPFAKALLLGDSSDLGYELDTAFKISGIRHIIAVSGLHVGFIYLFIQKLTGRNRYLAALFGIPAMLTFAALAGFTPSVTRASIMVCLMMIANLIGKEYDSGTELAFASLVMLCVNPFVITSVSFQLSVLSVAGILLFQPALYSNIAQKITGKKLKAQLLRGATASVSVTLSAMSLTVPLTAYYFGSVSLVSVLTNILTLWVVGFTFGGILFVCVIGSFSVAAGSAFAGIIAIPMRYVLSVAKMLAAIPYAAVYTKSIYIVIWVALCYLLVAYYVISRRGKIWYVMTGVTVMLITAVVLSWAVPRKDDLRVSVLDVGQGQSILLQCDGKNFLVDCGGNSESATADEAAEMLLSQGVSRLDGVMLTHYDRDHFCGLTNLMKRIAADVLFLPEEDMDGNVVPAAESAGIECRILENCDTFTLGKGILTFYKPENKRTNNEKSCGVLFEREDCAILVTGDQSISGEVQMVENFRIPELNVLIVGHHGSKNAASEYLLQAAKPEYAFISVGVGNSYGHPAQPTLDRLQAAGCKVYRTDRDGRIVYRRRGNGQENRAG